MTETLRFKTKSKTTNYFEIILFSRHGQTVEENNLELSPTVRDHVISVPYTNVYPSINKPEDLPRWFR